MFFLVSGSTDFYLFSTISHMPLKGGGGSVIWVVMGWQGWCWWWWCDGNGVWWWLTMVKDSGENDPVGACSYSA